MQFKILRIKNFRHFQNYEVRLLDDNFNLMVGENGAGKTTIFDSLRILFGKLSLSNFLNEKDFESGDPLTIEVILEIDKEDENLYLFKNCINEITEDSVKILIGFYQKDLDSERIYFGKKSFIDEDSLESEIRNFKINMFEIKRFIQVVYVDGTRTEHKFYSNKSFYTKVGKYLYNLDKGSSKEDSLINLSKKELKANAIMKKIIGKNGEENLSEYLNKIKLIQDGNKKDIDLDSDNDLPQSTFLNLMKLNLFNKHLDKNSTGWQYILFTIFIIFYIKKLKNDIEDNDNEDNKEKYYLILMEEPEAHLHPQMQRNLLNFLKKEFENINLSNLLVSTHSPNIVRAVKDIEKTIFINKGFNKSLPTNLSGNIENFKNKLNIFIDVNKAELLFARGIIFVEGIAEEILIPKLFEIENSKTLDNYGISVINVSSTDFYCYALYANCLNIPWVVITDGDITKKSNGEKRKRDHSDIFKDENYFIGFDTFEIDLAINNSEFIKEKIDSLKAKRQLDYILGQICDSNYKDKENDDFKDKYRKFFNNLGSKSNFAYNLHSNISNDFNVPNYIKKAFKSIVKKLNTEEVETDIDLPF